MSFKNNKATWPAEWSYQKAVILVWPHHTHDWDENLEQVEASYLQMCQAIASHEDVIVICYDLTHWQDVHPQLSKMNNTYKIHTIIIPTNDTWVRDSGPLTVYLDDQPTLFNFQFNGWGNKYNHDLDNLLNQSLFKDTFLKNYHHQHRTLILEGGSIDSDGQGTLLTTKSCLLNTNRNPELSIEQIEEELQKNLGVSQIHWLDVEPLAGDDTDGHIDTLARFGPNDTIAYLDVEGLEPQLKVLRTAQGNPYHLIPLPFKPLKNAQGKPLPASYANFLIVNQGVLVPQYGIEEDKVALKQIQTCFENYTLHPIDAKCFVEQGGSVHCLTMQVQ